MKKSWQEYEINDRELHEWLPWGGLIHPAVLKNKDESLMGVFSYTMELESQIPTQPASISFKNGWVIWTEVQKINGRFRCYMVVTWNPFFYKKSKWWNPFSYNKEWVINSLTGKAVHYDNLVEIFFETLQEIETALRGCSDIRLLKNEEILSFLFSTLSMTTETLPMMDLPLYLDAVFAKKIPFEVTKSSFYINDKHVGIVSLLGYPSNELLKILPYDFRFSRRMLFFGKKEATAELARYTKHWCENRSSIKTYITSDLLSQFNGYYTNNLIFYHEDKDQLEQQLRDIDTTFQKMGVPHIIETSNLKDIWWGTLPGIFRANLNPPIVSLDSLKELMLFFEKEENQDVSSRSIL